MGQRVILHRYEETGAFKRNGEPRLRVVESGSFDPDSTDNPQWVVDALESRQETPEQKPRISSWKATTPPEPSTTIESLGFNLDTEVPEGDEDEDGETVEDSDSEPATVIESEEFGEDSSEPSEVPVPPKGGPGSGLPVWIAYAEAKNVEVPEGATRDDVIAACEAAGVPTE